MRLTPKEIAIIKQVAFEHFGKPTKVWLFGSRVDDQQRGGDIDLYVETDITDLQTVLAAETHFWADLQLKLGEQRIDVLVDYPARQTRSPIFEVAKKTGVLL